MLGFKMIYTETLDGVLNDPIKHLLVYEGDINATIAIPLIRDRD